MTPRTRCSVIAPILLLLSSCITTRTTSTRPDATSLPSYEQLVARYNRNVEQISRLWSFAVVELTWREDGRSRFEQGEGQLAVVLPDRMSLTVGKLGHDVLRAGCNQTQYWLFDMRGSENTLHLGHHASVPRSVGGASSLPIRPRDLIRLLGVVRIDAPVGDTSPIVERFKGDYLIEPPGCNCRMVLDPKTARPVRIDLLDERGYSRVTARHERYGHLKTEGVSPGRWPFVATLITMTDARKRGRINLALSDTVGDSDAINPRWFDPALLAKALKPDVVVDMDQRPVAPPAASSDVEEMSTE